MQEGHRLFACGVHSKRLIQNVSPRLVVKCSSFHLKGQKQAPNSKDKSTSWLVVLC